MKASIGDFCKGDASVLEVLMDPKDQPSMCAALRAWEWSPDNAVPVLVLTTACDAEFDTVEALSTTVKTHHAALSKGASKSKYSLSPLAPSSTGDYHSGQFIELLEHFCGTVEKVIGTPLLCWIPSSASNSSLYVHILELIAQSPRLRRSKLIYADTPTRSWVAGSLRLAERTAIVLSVEIDEAAVASHFAELFAPAAAGRSAGTLPGSAAPDVVPPLRLGRIEPTEKQTRDALVEAGAPQQFSLSQAEMLRNHVISAAQQAGIGAYEAAIANQTLACALCIEAAVRPVEALMRMLLASYLALVGNEDAAILEYRKAAWRAWEDKGYTQMAQCRLACATMLLKRGEVVSAQDEYEQAAAAASIGQAVLLYVEALRMAGVCAMRREDKSAAFLHWNAAVERACAAGGATLTHSAMLHAATSLIGLLRDHGHERQATRVERLLGNHNARQGL
jgi:hypothetical protein